MMSSRERSPLHIDADVVVVGAGPTGLVSALLLANRGHHVALVEKWPEPYALPRAVGISHETLHCLQVAKVIEHVLPSVQFTPDGSRRGEICAANGEVLQVRLDSAHSTSGWPARASFSQPTFERILSDLTFAHPRVQVLRGWNATSVTEGDDDITVVAARWTDAERATEDAMGDGAMGDGDLRVRAKFVLGCDGANSIVRSGPLSDLEDLGFAYDWLVVDIVAHHPLELHPQLGQILGPPRPTSLAVGGPGRRRWEFMRLDGETMEELNDANTAWQLLAPFGVTPQNATLERHAVYTFRGRWSKQWRCGRSLLAGDAAHLMPPFLGEGFNSGVRDALAVTWRLDLILKGLVDHSVLDSYSVERLGHVRQIVEQAVEVGRIICMTDPVACAERDARLRIARDTGFPPVLPREWRLGAGLWDADDAFAGSLGIQANVAVGGKVGLFDDVVEHDGLVLLSIGDDPGGFMAPGTRAAWSRIGGRTVVLGEESGVVDVDGSYAEWFAERGIQLALIRPDFYVFGTATSAVDAERLVHLLLQLLGVLHVSGEQ